MTKQKVMPPDVGNPVPGYHLSDEEYRSFFPAGWREKIFWGHKKKVQPSEVSEICVFNTSNAWFVSR